MHFAVFIALTICVQSVVSFPVEAEYQTPDNGEIAPDSNNNIEQLVVKSRIKRQCSSDNADAGAEIGEAVGGVGGAIGGAAIGAGIGSIVPGLGTAIGAGIGGFLGPIFGVAGGIAIACSV